jgi:hypothetical protein
MAADFVRLYERVSTTGVDNSTRSARIAREYAAAASSVIPSCRCLKSVVVEVLALLEGQ